MCASNEQRRNALPYQRYFLSFFQMARQVVAHDAGT